MTVDTRATTLGMSAATHAARGKALLLPQQVIASPETRLRYRIDSLLGQGGFGQAYLATRVTRSLWSRRPSRSRRASTSTAG